MTFFSNQALTRCYFLDLAEARGENPMFGKNFANHLYLTVSEERRNEDNRVIKIWRDKLESEPWFKEMSSKKKKHYQTMNREKYENLQRELQRQENTYKQNLNIWNRQNRELRMKLDSLKGQDENEYKRLKAEAIATRGHPQKPNRAEFAVEGFPQKPDASKYAVKFKIPLECRRYQLSNGKEILALNATDCGGSRGHCSCAMLMKVWSPQEAENMFTQALNYIKKNSKNVLWIGLIVFITVIVVVLVVFFRKSYREDAERDARKNYYRRQTNNGSPYSYSAFQSM